jgi:hypothetical protein
MQGGTFPLCLVSFLGQGGDLTGETEQNFRGLNHQNQEHKGGTVRAGAGTPRDRSIPLSLNRAV